MTIPPFLQKSSNRGTTNILPIMRPPFGLFLTYTLLRTSLGFATRSPIMTNILRTLTGKRVLIARAHYKSPFQKRDHQE